MKFIFILAGYYFPPLDWLISISRWLKIRFKCFRYRKIICLSPFSWGCERCKLKEAKIRKLRVK